MLLKNYDYGRSRGVASLQIQDGNHDPILLFVVSCCNKVEWLKIQLPKFRGSSKKSLWWYIVTSTLKHAGHTKHNSTLLHNL